MIKKMEKIFVHIIEKLKFFWKEYNKKMFNVLNKMK